MNMNDDVIRGMLIERKRQARRKAATKEAIGNILCWVILFGGVFLFSMLGCAAGLN